MKKIIAMLMVLAIVLSLCACGGEPDPNAGVYAGIDASALGITMTMEEAFGEGVTQLELKNGGKGTITLADEAFPMKWSVDGTDITITVDGADSVGTLVDGVITVDLLDMGLVLTFEKQG